VGNGAAHHHDRAHAPCELGVKAEREAKISEWPNRKEINLSRRFARKAKDLRDGVFRSRTALWCWLVGVPEAILAMDPLGGREWLGHRAPRANSDRHVVEPAQFKQAASIDGGEVRGDVAMHAANSDEFDIAAPSKVEHGDRVIDPHVGV
jgi:hypothetical protein